ncbi:unnamed protein product, partial [Rotaria sp. Silwood1]
SRQTDAKTRSKNGM